jgi:hypothetical protein
VGDGTRRRPPVAVVLCAVVVAGCLAVVAQVTAAFVGPGGGTARVGAQTRWLDVALRDGAGQRMQALFPEGDYSTHALTGIAAARVALDSTGAERAAQLATARRSLMALDAPRNRDLFSGVTSPPDGVFYRGWRLLLLTEIARADGTDAERTASVPRRPACARPSTPARPGCCRTARTPTARPPKGRGAAPSR